MHMCIQYVVAEKQSILDFINDFEFDMLVFKLLTRMHVFSSLMIVCVPIVRMASSAGSDDSVLRVNCDSL